MKGKEELIENMRQFWINLTMGSAYSIENPKAKKCLMRDIKKFGKNVYWFCSKDIDKLVRKTIELTIQECEKEFSQMYGEKAKDIKIVFGDKTLTPEQAYNKVKEIWVKKERQKTAKEIINKIENIFENNWYSLIFEDNGKEREYLTASEWNKNIENLREVIIKQLKQKFLGE
ncbi:MAG: hypothetical protein ACE5KE_00225 [Methanosarcinales archaeon]